MRALTLCVLASLASGCVYSTYSLPPNQNVPREITPEDYPDSVEEEAARRSTRRKRALIWGPVELLAGAGLTAFFLTAEPEPPETGTVVGDLKEGGKQLLGMMLLTAAAGSVALMGLGDTVLGAVDGLFESPFVIEDAQGRRLMTLEEIAAAPPSESLQLDAHMGMAMSLRGFESQMGLGAFHWLGERFRLRYAITAGAGGRFKTEQSQDLSLSAGPEVMLELCMGERRKLGRYPGWSLGLFGSPGWYRIDAPGRDNHLAWRSGVALNTGSGSLRLGVQQVVGMDRSTAIEIGSVFPITTD